MPGRHFRVKADSNVTSSKFAELLRGWSYPINMDKYMKGAAKRLTFSLIITSTLGGCAVYGPAYPPYGYNDSDPYYAQPAYAAPVYIGPPLFLNFGLQYRSGGGGHGGRGFRGGGRR